MRGLLVCRFLTLFFSAHIPAAVIYEPDHYQLGDAECKCQNDSTKHIDRHFETWIYANDSTKADLIRHNRNEAIKKFYQRNHFQQKKGID